MFRLRSMVPHGFDLRFGSLLHVWMVVGISTSFVQAKAPLAEMVQVIIYYDAEQPGCVANARLLEEAIKSGLDQDDPERVQPRMKFQIEKHETASSSPAIALQKLRNLPTLKNETILFYFSGDTRWKDEELEMQFGEGWLPRKELSDVLRRKRSACALLLSDSISEERGEGQTREFRQPAIHGPILQGLLGKHRGFVDLHASTAKTQAQGNTEGGVFTRALVDLLCKEPQAVGAPRHLKSGFVPWREFVKHLKGEMQKANQTPATIELPPWRLGIRVKQLPGGELMITGVYPDSPAAQAGLQPSHVLETINGKTFESEAELAEFIDQLDAEELIIKVRGKPTRFRVQLAW
ncbi:Hypothetical protein PBC10988_10320 [Planctomycetales bacterium 10988]|nr:Hypothetical protein PBC10988_10320 [Planctomycetales bacterium 10988]